MATKVSGIKIGIGYANSVKNNWAELQEYDLDVDFPSGAAANLNERPFLDVLSSPIGEGAQAGAFPPYSHIFLDLKNMTGTDMEAGTDFDDVVIKIPARQWVQDSFATANITSLTERDFGLDDLTGVKLYADRPNFHFFQVPNLQYYRLGAASPSAMNKNNSTIFMGVYKN